MKVLVCRDQFLFDIQENSRTEVSGYSDNSFLEWMELKYLLTNIEIQLLQIYSNNIIG